MREILFRGKRKDNEDWAEGCLLHDSEQNESYIAECFEARAAYIREVIPETVGQFTGLTANGKKIFEGDIVKDKYSKGQYQYFKVIYDERTYRWETENKYGMLGQLCNVMGECEVIGNIHDNPELLGDK